MSSAHRPTWEPAKGKGDIAHLSQAFSKHSLPAQTKLKFRKPGDVQRRSVAELKAELEVGEKKAKIARNPDAVHDSDSETQAKRLKLEDTAQDIDADEDLGGEATAKGKQRITNEPTQEANAEDDDDDDDDDDDEQDEDEDDAEALMQELEKIKRERREEQERREQRDQVQDQMTREEEIARGNPLLNLENALHGDNQGPKMPQAQQRWDEDLIFRNQAIETPDLTKRGFVNDLTRTEFHKKFMSKFSHNNFRLSGGSLSRNSEASPWGGPAGAGKSTFCSTIVSHAQALGRSVHLFNLDPAAESFEYEPTIDIRELISLSDVMEEMDLGPNGGLIYCFDYLLNNLDWLENELGNFDNDYLIIDCPGQIELYTHFPVMTRFVSLMQQQYNFRVCAAYLLDSHFMDDKAKYFAGVLSAMSVMINLDVSHINIMTKMDLVYHSDDRKGPKYLQRREMERYLDPDPLLLADEANQQTNPMFFSLNKAIANLIDDYSMVSFLPLDLTEEESIATALSSIDNLVQYGEDEEPAEPKDIDEEVS